jgi:hypothetical protein
MSNVHVLSIARFCAFAGVLVLTGAPAAVAEPIDFMSEDELKSKCSVAGGTFIPSGGGSNVYACLGKGKKGALITCGGEGQYAGTCDVTPPARTVVDVSRIMRLRNGVGDLGLSAGN